MALAIHGTPVNTHDNSGTATTVSATITTTVADCILIAVVSPYHTGSSGPPTVTGVTGAGLTWTKRASNTYPNPPSATIRVGLEVWWAHAPAAVTAQAIQATVSSAPNNRLDIMVFAVSGSPNLSAPWDVNASVPGYAQVAGTALTNPTRSTTISATNAMIFGFVAYAWNANAANTAGSGFTNILAPTTDNSLRNHWEYKLVSSQASPYTVNLTGNQQFWVLISDALNGDAPANVTANGATVTVTSSISTAGTATGSASTAGATLTATTSIIAGSASIATAAGITQTVTTSLIPGSANVTATGATLTVTTSLIAGTASGTVSATAPGDTVTATTSLIEGTASALTTVAGDTMTVMTSVIPGSPIVDGTANGDTITITVSLIAGTASVDETGQTLTITTSVIAGTAFVHGDAAGDTVEVDLVLIPGGPMTVVSGAELIVLTQLIPGSVVSGAHGDGTALEVDLVLLPGNATVSGQDAGSSGSTLEVDLSIIPGEATGQVDAVANGTTLTVTVSLDVGAATGQTPQSNGDTVTVGVALIPGAATGGFTRVAGGMPYGPSTPQYPAVNVVARGALLTMGVRIERGGVNVIEQVREIIREVPVPMLSPMVSVTPVEHVTATGHAIVQHLMLEAGKATGDAIAYGQLVEGFRDWGPYDDAVLTLVLA